MPGKKNKTKMIPVSPESLGFRTDSGGSSSSGTHNARTPGSLAPESLFRLTHPAVSPASPIVDTHTHLALTFESYRRKYPTGQYTNVHDFVRALYVPAGVQEIVDVWMEAPVRKRLWREYADSALTEESRRDLWGGLGYWFVMGVHPHNAQHYTDAVEADMCVCLCSPPSLGR